MPRRAATVLTGLLCLVGLCFLLDHSSQSRRAHAEDGRVDLLLVLAADISRSVDERKFRLQRDGYAAAISDPRVVRAMTGGPHGRIALSFVEWAGELEQVVIVQW